METSELEYFSELLIYLIFHRTSQVVFKAGKNHDGCFNNDDLIKQVELIMALQATLYLDLLGWTISH